MHAMNFTSPKAHCLARKNDTPATGPKMFPTSSSGYVRARRVRPGCSNSAAPRCGVFLACKRQLRRSAG